MHPYIAFLRCWVALRCQLHGGEGRRVSYPESWDRKGRLALGFWESQESLPASYAGYGYRQNTGWREIFLWYSWGVWCLQFQAYESFILKTAWGGGCLAQLSRGWCMGHLAERLREGFATQGSIGEAPFAGFTGVNEVKSMVPTLGAGLSGLLRAQCPSRQDANRCPFLDSPCPHLEPAKRLTS